MYVLSFMKGSLLTRGSSSQSGMAAEDGPSKVEWVTSRSTAPSLLGLFLEQLWRQPNLEK